MKGRLVSPFDIRRGNHFSPDSTVQMDNNSLANLSQLTESLAMEPEEENSPRSSAATPTHSKNMHFLVNEDDDEEELSPRHHNFSRLNKSSSLHSLQVHRSESPLASNFPSEMRLTITHSIGPVPTTITVTIASTSTANDLKTNVISKIQKQMGAEWTLQFDEESLVLRGLDHAQHHVSLCDYICGPYPLHSFTRLRKDTLARRVPKLELISLEDSHVIMDTTTMTTTTTKCDNNGVIQFIHHHVHTHRFSNGKFLRTESENTTMSTKSNAGPGLLGSMSLEDFPLSPMTNFVQNVADYAVGNVFRGLVSKKKMRFQAEGYDLDLAYITPKIIAMGYPSEGRERLYRNPMEQVEKFFNEFHPNHYMIYNLCSERWYDESKFQGRCVRFPFNDHCPPQYREMLPFCKHVDEFLKADPANVVAIHCKAGKGRTGTMIAAYLVYSQQCRDADEALRLFAETRTYNGKGVTIPSQIRYVKYFAHNVTEFACLPPPVRVMILRKVILRTTPRFHTLDHGCDPHLTIYIHPNTKVYDSALHEPIRHHVDKPEIVFRFQKPIVLREDVQFMVHHVPKVGGLKSKPWLVLHCWVHTSFVDESNRMTFKKHELDEACKDREHKLFDENFEFEIVFEPLEDL
eukprot:PhF_6_TR42134/c0_g1_i3/m.63643/K01110/PTEN; phosphatidylinositol-3,4,5-trisphosphate 3-phosphatase and dual-specificity protein phosphatase PTEN